MFLKRKVEDLIGKRSAALKIKFLQTKLNNGRSIDKSWPVHFLYPECDGGLVSQEEGRTRACLQHLAQGEPLCRETRPGQGGSLEKNPAWHILQVLPLPSAVRPPFPAYSLHISKRHPPHHFNN